MNVQKKFERDDHNLLTILDAIINKIEGSYMIMSTILRWWALHNK